MTTDDNKNENPEEFEEFEEEDELGSGAPEEEYVDTEDDGVVRTTDNLIDIPDFESSPPEVQEYMEELIAKINMDDDESIINYGAEVLEELERVSDEINDTARRDGVLRSTMNEVYEQTLEGDTESIIEMIQQKMQDVGKGTVNTAKRHPMAILGALGGLLTLGPLGMAGGAALGEGAQQAGKLKKKRQRQQEGEIPEEIEEMLRTASQRLKKLEATLREADQNIPQWNTELKRLGKTRLETYKEISLWVGAGLEKEKRIRDNELAVARKAVEEGNPSVLKMEEMERVADFTDKLRIHINDMIIARGRLINNTQRLKEQQRLFENAHRKVRVQLKQGLPQQKDSIAGISFALRSGDLAKALREMDNFTAEQDRMAGEAQDMIAAMIDESSSQGVHNSERVIANLEKTTQRIRQIADQRRKLSKQEDKTREIMQEKLEDMADALKEKAEADVEYLLERNSAKQIENKKDKKKPAATSTTTPKSTKASDEGTTSAKKGFNEEAKGGSTTDDAKADKAARAREAMINGGKRRKGPAPE